MNVGSLEVVPVLDGLARITPAELFAAVGKALDAVGRGGTDADWAPHRDLLDAEGRLEMPVGAFVVRTGGRVLLVDAGYGREFPATLDGGHLLASLAEA